LKKYVRGGVSLKTLSRFLPRIQPQATTISKAEAKFLDRLKGEKFIPGTEKEPSMESITHELYEL
jgi:hypothetical protein